MRSPTRSLWHVFISITRWHLAWCFWDFLINQCALLKAV